MNLIETQIEKVILYLNTILLLAWKYRYNYYKNGNVSQIENEKSNKKRIKCFHCPTKPETNIHVKQLCVEVVPNIIISRAQIRYV